MEDRHEGHNQYMRGSFKGLQSGMDLVIGHERLKKITR